MIVDVHAHLWDDTVAQAARQAAAGIDMTVLSSTRFHPESAQTLPQLRDEFGRLLDSLTGGSATDSYRHSMDELCGALTVYPGSAVAMCTAPMGDLDHVEAVLGELLSDSRMVGIGEICPPGGRAAQLEPFMQVAAGHGNLPVLAHGFLPNTGEDVVTYADLAGRYPQVPLIVGAFGGMSSMSLIELAAEHSNLFLDLSSALQVFMVRAAVNTVPEQCLFGSNSPYGDPVASRHLVEAAVDDRHVLDQVLGDNATRVFGLS